MNFILRLYRLCTILILFNFVQSQNGDVESTLSLLNDAEDNIEIKQNPELILVFGNGDKINSAFIKYITGHDQNLYAKNLGNNNYALKDKSMEIDTSYPKLYISKDNDKIAYYDCTKFHLISDVNDPVFPIVTSFYVKKITEYARNIKILFVFDYSNVDKQNLDAGLFLMSQAESIFRNMRQYTNSIGLIITNADLVVDHNIVPNYLRYVKHKYGNLDTAYSLLSQRIEYFGQISPGGSLDSLISHKRKIQNFIRTLQFHNRQLNDNDFDIQLPTKSKDLLYKIVTHINSLRSKMISKIDEKLQAHFTRAESYQEDIETFKDLIDSNLQKLEKIIDRYYEDLNAKKFVKHITEYMEKLNVPVPSNLNNDILKYDELMKFFIKMEKDGSIRTSSIQWVTNLENVELYIDDLNCLYRFIIDFSNKLSETIVQQQIDELNIDRHFHYTLQDKVENFNASTRLFYTKLMKIGTDLTYTNSHLYYRIENKTINGMQFSRLKNAYLHAIEILKLDCNRNDKITFYGYNIKISDIRKNINELTNKKSACFKKFIEIFATNKIIFDEGWGRMLDGTYILIIAPTWEKVKLKNNLKFEIPVIGIGANFIDRENTWDLKHNADDLFDVNNLKIIDVNESFQIDAFAKQKKQLPALSKNINAYKKLLFDKLMYPLFIRGFDKFLKSLSASPETNELYKTMDFYDNFNMLENYVKKGKINFIPLYESLARGLQLYIESPRNVEETPDLDKVQKNLYSAVLSKVISLTATHYNSLVLDHEKYLSFAMDNARDYKDNHMIFSVGKKKLEYNEKINQKIQEGSLYIEKELKPETERLNKQIITAIRVNLVQEIKDLEKKSEKEKKDLTKMIIGQSIGTILGIVGTGLSFLGPVGMAVGSAMNIAGSVIASATSSPMPQIREDLKPKLNNLKNFINTQQKSKEEVVMKQIQVLQETNEPSILAIAGETLKFISGLDNKKYDKAQEFVLRKLDDLQKKNSKLPKIAVQAIDKVKSFSKVAGASSQIFSQFKNDIGKIGSMASLLDRKNDEIKNLGNLRSTILDSFVPLLDDMANDISAQLDDNHKSRISVYIKQYKIQTTLIEFQSQLRELTAGFAVDAEIVEYMTKLNRAIEITITIFDQIQIYEEQKDLATYIAEIRTAGMINHFVSEQYKSLTDNLTLYAQSNIVLENYLTAVNAIKQFAFPFANFYSKSIFFADEAKTPSSLTSLALKTIDKVSELQKKTKEFVSTYSKDRSLDLMNYYEINGTFAKPFYVWKDDKYRPLISKLLKGNEIILESQITKHTRNALKFSEIQFSIKSDVPEIQSELNKELNNYVIDLVHMGNSYYKCGNKVYSIASSSAILRHSFYQDRNRKFIYESNLHRELSNDRFILSPYASWKVKLTDETQSNNFTKLMSFDTSDIYLTLSGRAQYVPSDVKCDNNLEEYYKLASVF